MALGLPVCALRGLVGRRSPLSWRWESAPSIASPQGVPKFRKGLVEPRPTPYEDFLFGISPACTATGRRFRFEHPRSP